MRGIFVVTSSKTIGSIDSLPGTTFLSSAKIKGLVDELQPFWFLAIIFVIVIIAISRKRKGIRRRNNSKVGCEGKTTF
jgi:hypothetical protein